MSSSTAQPHRDGSFFRNSAVLEGLIFCKQSLLPVRPRLAMPYGIPLRCSEK
jgi:hypothetical protein